VSLSPWPHKYFTPIRHNLTRETIRSYCSYISQQYFIYTEICYSLCSRTVTETEYIFLRYLEQTSVLISEVRSLFSMTVITRPIKMRQWWHSCLFDVYMDCCSLSVTGPQTSISQAILIKRYSKHYRHNVKSPYECFMDQNGVHGDTAVDTEFIYIHLSCLRMNECSIISE
jgi:hypothetical protein